LGVQADLWERRAGKFTPKGDAGVLDYLNRFIKAHKFLEQGSPVTLVAGNVPVGPASVCMVADGLMVVGDAARQVDPLTGGGIIHAITAGKIAAQAAVEALVAGDTSTAFLSRYETAWQQALGRKVQRNYRLRMKFSLEQRVDERFAQAFALTAGG
jgi:digeranylgeranylglycerophospholipid reductase